MTVDGKYRVASKARRATASPAKFEGASLLRSRHRPEKPTWWPADTEEISYRLVRSLGGIHYQIGSTRSEGVPICVIGHLQIQLIGYDTEDEIKTAVGSLRRVALD